jgi:hypothetical protein
MDRQQVYALAIPYETDFLAAQRFTQEGLGLLALDLLGAGPVAAGLACTPTSPASLAVMIGPGRLYQLTFLDAAAYGQIAGGNPAGGLTADTDPSHQVLKQGLLRDPVTLSCPAPQTGGATVNYLIEAQFQEADIDPSVLQFFNTQNPSTPLAGPPNSPGAMLPTVRACTCILQVKAGTPVIAGTPATPIADAGWVGLYAVTVANGQTAITAANISVVSGAPFLTQTLLQLGNTPSAFAVDTSIVANAITANPAPALTSYAAGTVLRILPANAATGPVTANINGLGAISVTRPDGTACVPNDLRVGKAFDVVIKTGPVMQMLSWPQVGDGPKNALVGAAHAYAVADAGNATWRSNGGAAMIDTLPGASAGALPAGWAGAIINADATGLLAIQVGAGSTLSGPSVSNGVVVLGPGQKVTVMGDGTNYQCFSAFERAKLTANTTLFVSTSGSDTGNVGISAASPFATAGHAYSWAQQVLDLAGVQLVISLAGGTYAQSIIVAGQLTGQNAPIVFSGAGSGSTTISVTAGGCVISLSGAFITIENMTLSASGASSGCIGAGGSSSGALATVFIGPGVTLGAAVLAHIVAGQAGMVMLSNSYSVTSGAQAHWFVQNNGMIQNGNTAITLTLSGTPAFSVAFATATAGGQINPSNVMTFSGSATGARYTISSGGSINTNGSGQSYLPGNAAGTGQTANYY